LNDDSSEIFWDVDTESVLNPPQGSYYEISISEFFNAHHFVTFNGKSGPKHAHSFRLDVRCINREASRDNPVLVDYHVLDERVVALVMAYNNTLLNDLPPFLEIQPTSENLLGVIFQQLERAIEDLPVQLKSITLWEAPTKSVTYNR
jgi:6-pyruvoyltetrahydropterin/6-carboxytetrahydropterin synthase